MNFPQSWTCFPRTYMLMFPPRRWYHHNLQLTDGLTILANWLEIVAILVHHQPYLNVNLNLNFNLNIGYSDRVNLMVTTVL